MSATPPPAPDCLPMPPTEWLTTPTPPAYPADTVAYFSKHNFARKGMQSLGFNWHAKKMMWFIREDADTDAKLEAADRLSIGGWVHKYHKPTERGQPAPKSGQNVGGKHWRDGRLGKRNGRV